MSFLDNVITEKPAIVIDIGHAYTKCGFAGENGPHTIIPSKIIQNNVTIKIHDYKAHKKSNSSNFNLKSIDIEEESLKEILNDFLFRIFFKILNSNARERKVVIVESILTDSFFRKVLADVLYKSFQVLSVLFLPSHLATLYALGLNTGLVIDCGFVDCQLLPITESVPMSGLCDFVNLGAQKIHQEILEIELNISQKYIDNLSYILDSWTLLTRGSACSTVDEGAGGFSYDGKIYPSSELSKQAFDDSIPEVYRKYSKNKTIGAVYLYNLKVLF
jgi:actin-related protein